MRKTILTAAALLAGLFTSSATIIPYAWFHAGENGFLFDSGPSAGAHSYSSAFSSGCLPGYGGGGNASAVVVNLGVGGPLGNTGYSSTESTLWGAYNCGHSGMWVGSAVNGSDAPPTTNQWDFAFTNWVMECWVLPIGNGCSGDGHTHAQFLSTGSGQFGQPPGGAAFVIDDNGDGTSSIRAQAIHTSSANDFYIGNPVLADTTRWTHLAVVVENGTGTFYVNGVAHGSPTNGVQQAFPQTTPYAGSGGDTASPYHGYMDEMRFSSFAAGQFSTSDLLLRPAGPNIITQPEQSVTVWNGGAAPFRVITAYDTSTTYQWRRGGTNIGGATSSLYVLPTVTLLDTSALFDCVVKASGISVTSTVATLTVVDNNPSNIAVYRHAVTNEPSLVAFFPADSNTGSTLTNVADATRLHDGTLELGAIYDSRTNRAFGQRAVSFNGDGDVQIPNNSAFEFQTEGTIEALVYMDPAAAGSAFEPVIFSEAYDGSTANYYVIRATSAGSLLTYANDQTSELSWVVPGGLFGKLSHVVLTFDHGTNVTAYVNGQNLGTKQQTSFGTGAGSPAWIGSMGTNSSSAGSFWVGSIDELAVYTTALSLNTIQIHYSDFFYGTNTSAPKIVSLPASRTLLAGSSPILTVQASGTLPLTYQWKSNGVPILGATAATVVISNATVNANYSVGVTNAYGGTNSPNIALTFGPAPSTYAAAVLQDGPSSFWRLSESSGTNIIDSSGYNDGAYNGSLTLGAPTFHGESGTGVRFSGGKGLVPNSSSFNPSGPYTIELWVKPASVGFYVPLSDMNRPARDSGYEWYLQGNFNGFEFHTGGSGGYNAICGDATAPTAGKWYHIVGLYDGSLNIYQYVNGQPASQFSDNYVSEGASPFAPNVTLPMWIGGRSDGTHFWDGTICDVAFYNYMLSSNQIVAHYTVSYYAASITTQPVGVTNVEGSTISLSVVADGLPNTYHWYKGSTMLSPTLNFDGTPHYSQDVTNATLVIAQAVPTDSGQYHVVVSNPIGGATSSNATVLITADTNKPVMTSVTGLGTPNIYNTALTPFLVKVTFDKRVSEATANAAANYSLNGGVAVSQAQLRNDLAAPTLGTDWKTVYLTTSGLTPGQKYTLTVTGVVDQAQSPNTMAPASLSFWAPPLTQGALLWDYYYTINGGVAGLQGFAWYPYGPSVERFTTIFDSTQITGGDLNNQGYGSLGDYYGSTLSGWITPTVTTNYYFFLASDDASELDLSSDDTPAGAQKIAEETSCCHGFQEPGAATTSTPQALVAGHHYFIRAVHTEGVGNDYVKVAWKMEGDPTPTNNLVPIASQYLSAYVLLPPTFNPPVFTNGSLTISWTGYQTTLVQSTNVALPLSQWTPVPGNPNPYTITPAAGVPKMFYRLVQ